MGKCVIYEYNNNKTKHNITVCIFNKAHFNSSSPAKMTAISQTFSNAYSWMKSFAFWFEYYRGFYLRAQLTISSIGSGNSLVLSRWHALTWTNAEPFHWRIYEALGGMRCIWSSCKIRHAIKQPITKITQITTIFIYLLKHIYTG